MRLDGARALITGATGGVGQSIARATAARGAVVVLTGRRADVLGPLAIELGGHAIEADLADRASIQTLVDEAGDLDVVVANAALPGSGLLTSFGVEEIDRALDVNLRAPVVTARLVAEQMIARGRGHLVFISSLSGKVASGGASIYSSTKFGLRGFGLALREELRPYGVGVSTVFPGFVRDAGMFADAEVKLPWAVGTSTPDEVANAVVRAIERNLGEVDVAPLLVRLSATLATIAPGISTTIQARLGGDRIAAELAKGQAGKR